MQTLKKGLSGHLKIAAIPTALPMVSALTTPYRAKHPHVKFTILSRTSIEILSMVENLEVDAGLTYIDNEPLGRLRAIPLYLEQYRLLTSADSPLGDHDKVTWAEVGKIPLCLLTPDMQNRRIIDGLLHAAGTRSEPTLESNSMIVLFSHVRTGRWASVMPERLADTLGLTEEAACDSDRGAGGRSADRCGSSATRTNGSHCVRLGGRSPALSECNAGLMTDFDRFFLSQHSTALMRET